jgi:hypothetical protein
MCLCFFTEEICIPPHIPFLTTMQKLPQDYTYIFSYGHTLSSLSFLLTNLTLCIICPGVVGIPTGYGLDDRRVEVRVPMKSRIFAFHVAQIGFGAHPASYPMRNGRSSTGENRQGRIPTRTGSKQHRPRNHV